MPNHMKFCSCRQCRAGRHAHGRDVVRRAVRKFRQTAKRLLRRGETPDGKIGVPYTD